MNRWTIRVALGPAALAVLAAGPLSAQDTTRAQPVPTAAAAGAAPVTITLEQALEQARKHSPTYLQTLNDAGPARWQVRNAYGQLLPSASVSAGLGYTGSGNATFGGTTFSQSSPSYNSDYSISLQYQLDGAVLSGPGRAKALQRATEADIANAGAQLKYAITNQYLQTLQAAAQVEVAHQQVQRNEDFLALANARYRVGQATLIDVRQAEVTKGTGEVALLRAVQAQNEAKLELLRLMGVTPPAAVDQLQLTDSFAVVAPGLELEQLLQLASEQNPELRALRARESAAGANLTAAKSEYLPRLSMQAGWQGYTQQFTNEQLLLDQQYQAARGQMLNCEFQNAIIQRLTSPLPYENGGMIGNCNSYAGLTSDGSALEQSVADGIRSRNSVFPFHYTRQPFQASLTLSLPIFTGFGRQLRVSQARVQQEDAAEGVRARALQVRTDVQARWLGLQTAYRAIGVQQTSRDAAREQLRLAQDRYRLGSGTALELADAQNAVARAEGDYVSAVYDYHKALAALEAAVGRPLR
ncbi:MAG TPA: TolC family protein [Gemmatimonadales bacterium]|nr:TolC family protein [Gemmatimonadales bacterium]